MTRERGHLSPPECPSWGRHCLSGTMGHDAGTFKGVRPERGSHMCQEELPERAGLDSRVPSLPSCGGDRSYCPMRPEQKGRTASNGAWRGGWPKLITWADRLDHG
jgi:hypothetical protein